ncbi:hypothetical protein AHAS_Ahas13G0235600 [Arachis hypogaea]
MMERFNCRARDSYEILLDENGWKGFTQSNAKISIFDGSVIETNRELQEAKLIVQKWRFGTSPDGVHLLRFECMHLVLEEPEPGVTVVKLTHNDVPKEYRFVPPENFDLALLTFELEFIKKGTKSEQIDAPQQSKQLRKRFANQGLNLNITDPNKATSQLLQ